jgi:methionyl aminopeptidase
VQTPTIPFIKSDEEIQNYLELGPMFGSVLYNTYKAISTKTIITPKQTLEFLTELSKDTFHGMKISFPFVNETNYFDEKFNSIACISVNDVAGHGRYNKKFKETDIISVDFGITINRLNFDGAFTYGLEPWVYSPLKAIKNVTNTKCNTTKDISKIIQETAREEEVDIIASIAGHGIGKKLHEPPIIHNALGNFIPFDLIKGLCFCIEPLYVKRNIKKPLELVKTYIDSDGWSIKTVDSQPASHFETMYTIFNRKMVDLLDLSKWNLEEKRKK